MSAVLALQPGLSRSRECQRLIQEIKPLMDKVSMEIKYVKGSDNLADGPSRKESMAHAATVARRKEAYKATRQQFFQEIKSKNLIKVPPQAKSGVSDFFKFPRNNSGGAGAAKLGRPKFKISNEKI